MNTNAQSENSRSTHAVRMDAASHSQTRSLDRNGNRWKQLKVNSCAWPLALIERRCCLFGTIATRLADIPGLPQMGCSGVALTVRVSREHFGSCMINCV